MTKIIKPNWEIFKAKFSENPQSNFEWFCYLLFCKEFNQNKGILRFKNQHAIETNPIQINDKVIGWQAKFYDTPLSSHKSDLIKTILEAKKKYTNITTLYLYSNREWSQNKKGGSPASLIEINQVAENQNIDLIWKTTSYFESEFVSVENKVFAEHFFSFKKSIFNLIIEQQKHSENILDSIQTSIKFKNENIEIDRSEEFEKIKDKSQNTFILSGHGGAGKTVLIKKLYEQHKENIPMYVFKANEFELRNINEFYKEYSFYDFSESHKNDSYKIIVIDSAEKLLDLTNIDPFKEFLSIIIKDNWTIFFTTRDNFLDNLYYQFFEHYNISPSNIVINNLDLDSLRVISNTYSFSLPKDEKLLELIKSPFYLNEYLKFYNNEEYIDYCGFKNKIWDKNIKKSQAKREISFLQIAFERANSGQFFVNPNSDLNQHCDDLVSDGILGYESAGYFITHDIYEEWALERTIESEYIKKIDYESFFKQIGQSLSIRRCFRNWLSEKLLLENANIKTFIEDIIESDSIQAFWKDEIFVSVLLSKYSSTFFVIFKDELLTNEQSLLKKLTFILRTACKEIDDDFLKQLGLKDLNLFSLEYISTKPKGYGWESIIKFVFDYIEIIGIKNINFILPIIHDWNSKFRKGTTTRISSLIALQYYQWIIDEKVYLSRDDTKKHLIQSIIYGSYEIKDELKDVFDEIITNKWKNHGDPYTDLSNAILSDPEGVYTSVHLPQEVLNLADLFWSYSPKNNDSFYSSRLEIEQHFGLEHTYGSSYPPSAHQTPIYLLLNYHRQITVDFIINFVNKSIQSYASSNFDNYVEEVTVFLDDEKIQKQYISNCLWNMYRGTGSPVSPYLLQSIHMALEKYLLEFGERAEAGTLENWLLYLLKYSKSASITSVVTSVVLAYPEKTINVALVLFKTKKFIIQDTTRLVSEHGARSLYSIGENMGSSLENALYDNERIKTCDEKHRKWTLESLFLNYQCFRSAEVSEDEANKRQGDLWAILDKFYSELPPESEQTNLDKTWRLFLARMDKRKMNITTEATDGGIAINFNPELESDLQNYSEQSLGEISEFYKYNSLKIWADYKFNNDNKCKTYEQYEATPKLAINEIKDIIEQLSAFNSTNDAEKEDFVLLYQSTPAYVCSVLLRDHIHELKKAEKEFCADIVLEVAFSALQPNYRYQITDGVQQAISVLPCVLKIFPEQEENIKSILLFNMFNDSHVGGMLSSQCFSIFPIIAIQDLWESNFISAQSLFLGYLLLKPKYDSLSRVIRQENYDNGNYERHSGQLLNRFIKENEDELQRFSENRLSISNIQNIGAYDLSILRTALRILLNKIDTDEHKTIANIIISTFAEKLTLDDRDYKIDYQVKYDFLRTYTYLVLMSPKNEVQDYIQPFLENFNSSEVIADLFKEFVITQDRIDSYDNFWIIWTAFKKPIFKLCEKGDSYRYVDKIVKSYLFSRVPWQEGTKEWHTLKEQNNRFFREISHNIGHCPSALYAISKLLNDIGSCYIDDGIFWISNILKNHDFSNKKLEVNTIYYIENLVRKYTSKNRQEIKRTPSIKVSVLVVLDYLIAKGSVIGYMLRESIV